MIATSTELASEVLRLRLSQMLINERYKDGQFKVPTPAELSGKAISAKVTVVDGLNGEDNNVAGFSRGTTATDTLASMGASPVSDAWA